jgi:DNA-binding NtrC family response regulator
MTQASELRILVVDDEESMRMTLGANLELEGFDVVEAASAAEALQAVKNGPAFDLVLSDIRMPGMNGVEMFLELKELSPDVPVILMTAFSTEETVKQAVQSGVFAVLGKPFEIEHSIEAIQRAAKRPMVIVVDDAEAVATSTAEALSVVGVRAMAVSRPEDAISLIAEGKIDVCLTDLAMPGMSGVELLEKIKKQMPEVAVIVFSGASNGEELMRQAAGRGAFQCLRKPLDPSELIATIANARVSRS